MTCYRQPGTVLTDHVFAVPLDHGRPDGEQIEVFAREVVATASAERADRLPWLVFLQGGPGFAAQRPVGRQAWLDRALDDYRVLLLDQRGTGRSSRVTARSLAPLGSPEKQAEYLAHFRADSIVLDAELIRRELAGGEPWSVLGQSFGGFCTVTYLSFAPHGMREALITGGLPGLDARAEDVYQITYRICAARNAAHYEQYPGDVEAARRVAEHLASHEVTLPGGGPLTVEGLPGSGADFLEPLKKYVLDGATIIASPHKIFGPQTNDLSLQLRKRGISQIILAGMAANLCVESHLRHLLEEGFEVAVVRDATAAPRIAAGDAYQAAVTNYTFLAHAVWTTQQAASHMSGDA